MENLTQPTMEKQEAKDLPSALRLTEEIQKRLGGKKPAVFMDYDGCLAPIVSDPSQAIMSEEMRSVLRQLAAVCTVAVVSGRDRKDVEQLVQLDTVYYAGSHGFDITGPNGMQAEPGQAAKALSALGEAETALKKELKDIQGSLVERKRYAIAVHYRNVAPEQVQQVKAAVKETVARHADLKKGKGKKVVELKPNLDWHKGKAILWLLEELGLNKEGVVPVFVGDDITDEDAFVSLQGRGITVLVGEHAEKTAAIYHLENIPEVKIFLEGLVKSLS